MIGLRCITLLVLISIINVSLQSSDASSCDSSCLAHAECKDCKTKKSDIIVVCYFTNWAWYRNAPAKFLPENINASLCTHINYAFTILDNKTLTMVPSDSWADIDNKFYERVVAYGEKGVVPLVSVGGWTNSQPSVGWSKMMSTASSRKTFIDSVVEFLKKYKFGGLDMDYEYPGCPQGDTSAALAEDVSNFNKLMSELKEAFNDEYLLTIATAAGKTKIDECYDMVPLFKIVDWINVMAYEYHSSSDGETGAMAPLCGTSNSWGVHETIDYYLNTLRCPPDRLVLGLPFYGATYTLAQSSKPMFGEPVTGPGTAGPYTGSAGVISYMETCQLILESGYNTGYDIYNNSYSWKDNQFIGFEGVSTIHKKVCFIKNFNLRGAMFWTLDYDDFNNVCGFGSYPLLKTLNYHLGRTDTRVIGAV